MSFWLANFDLKCAGDIDFPPQGESTSYKSQVKFYIDYDKDPPQAEISLIEAMPQRQGLGKLLIHMVAHIGKDLNLKNVSTLMNTPEEKMFLQQCKS